MQLKKIYYFSSTHWDREWYSVFQRYRFRLLGVTDEIIDILNKNKDFSHFTFDGQVSPIRDYLEIRGDKQPALMNLIREKRLSVGPWYTMPDEFLVSGESLIHNLRLGFEECRKLGGEPMRFGYICDIFGHIAQMPQIFTGFSIPGALIARAGNDFELNAYFRWISPDGSEIITYRAPESMGYGCFYAEVIQPKYKFNEKNNQSMFVRAEKYVEREITRAQLPYIVLMDGMDHEHIHLDALEIAQYLSKKYACPVVFDSLEHLISEVAPYVTTKKEGELNRTARDPAEHNKLITYTLSSRVDLKLYNDKIQTVLEKWALPLTALANRSRIAIPDNLNSKAYKYLILNQAHDSICGCSIDEVHRDMIYRYCQADYITQEVCDEAFRCLTEWEPSENDEKLFVKVFNPLPFKRCETICIKIHFPIDWKNQYYEQVDTEKINCFHLYSDDGAEIKYQLLKIERKKYCHRPDHLGTVLADVYTILIDAILPPCGYVEYKVLSSEKPTRWLTDVVKTQFLAENESVRLKINENGTFDILDKSNGISYTGLHYFLDDADVGDGWFYYAPVQTSTVTSKGAKHCIEKVSEGIVGTVFRVTTYMAVPEKAEFGNTIKRSDKYIDLKIVSEITLGRNKWVDISTTVDNVVEDHRLRMVIPVNEGITDKYIVNQVFCFIERNSGVEKGTNDWWECAKQEKQFENIVLRRTKAGGGLAFISKGGMHEVAATDDEETALAVTMFRGFRRTVGTNGQIDGQVHGKLHFDYRIMPIAQENFSDLVRIQNGLSVGVMYATGTYGRKGDHSFLQIDSEHCIISCIERVNNVLDVRFYNCSEKTDVAIIKFNFEIREAYEVDLEGRQKAKLGVRNNTVCVSVAPWQIKTVEIL